VVDAETLGAVEVVGPYNMVTRHRWDRGRDGFQEEGYGKEGGRYGGHIRC
jgi:hypothetical protein